MLNNDGNGGITGTHDIYVYNDPNRIYYSGTVSGTLTGTHLVMSGSGGSGWDVTWSGNTITGLDTSGRPVNMVLQP
jgi:hypothetical protein